MVPAPADSPIEVAIESGKSYWWCACGLSKKQPFCDGSHKGTSYTPLHYKPAEGGLKWLCVCKRTKDRPFCDGSHNQPLSTESEPAVATKEA